MRLNFSRMLKHLGKWMVRHQPELMHAMGFAAGASALVLTATGTAKAIREVDETEEVKPMTKADKALVYAKHYIPAGLATVASVTFHVAGIKTYARRNAMLTSLSATMYDRLTKLEEKNMEVLGEKKATQIQDEIAKDGIKGIDISNAKETGHGNCLFKDEYNGQIIRSSATYINDLINTMNRGIINAMAVERGERLPAQETAHYPSLYDWELAMGEDVTTFAPQMGWYNGTLIHAHISYEKHESGEPIGIITFAAKSMPLPNPNRLYTYGYS